MKTAQAQNIFHGGVWQDKNVPSRVRALSSQPVMVSDPARTPLSNTTIPRTKKHSTSRRLRQIASWVDDPIVLQLQEIAQSHKPLPLSMSETIRDLLQEILRQKFEKQQAATLPTLIDKAVSKANRALGNRLVFFDMRNAIAAEQTRILTTDLYKRQLQKEGVSQEKIAEKLDKTYQMARANVLKKTPQLKPLIEEWEALFAAEPEEGKGK